MRLNLLVLGEQQLQNTVFWKLCFNLSDMYTKMSSVFGTGQSTNSMARIMKANQMRKESLWTEFQRYGGPADCHGKRINLKAKRETTGKKEKQRKTSGQKEKPQGKKKKTHGKKNNLTAKEKRIKNVLSASKKFWNEFCYFCCEVFPFAVRFFLAVRLILLPWKWWATVQRWRKQQAIG